MQSLMSHLGSKEFCELDELIDSARHFYDWHRRRLLAKLRHLNYKKEWGGSLSNPNSLLQVKTANIKYKVIGFGHMNTVGTHILDGNWDQEVVPSDLLYPNTQVSNPRLLPIEQWTYYMSSNKFFNHEIPWEETHLYEYFKQKCQNKSEVVKKLKEFEYVYERMQSEGYKTQRKLIEENKIDSYESKSLPGHDEICVAIGRQGDIYQMGKGNHRMAISKVLEIEKIPVRVLVRHKKWQQKRHNVYLNIDDYEKSDISHPDLAQLFD